IIDRETFRQNFVRLVLDEPERLLKWNLRWNHTLNAYGIELLELFQLSRLSGRTEARKRRQWHQPVCGSRDVHFRKLIGRQTLRALNLRNDFVAWALDPDLINKVPANQI